MRSTGVNVSHQFTVATTLPPQIIKPLYRIVQESLTNICKYANATKLQLNLQATPEGVYLIIEDNGQGFNLESYTSGFGLQGMRERVETLRGEFKIETAPGAGCRISVKLPLKIDERSP